VFDTAARQRVMDRLDNEVALHRALERGEFRLWYQPEVAVADGRIVGIEALLRWEHPRWGLQLPAQFLPLAEETGLILPIGEWALEEACRQAQTVRSAGTEFSSLVVWVNLSVRQLVQPDLVAMIARILAETATDPALLGLEITETVLMDDVSSLRERLRQLKELGLRLAIDDFGTGFSSLSWLRQFPVDVLKVDRSFVDGMGDADGDRAIVDAVVRLARSLDMVAVAEGVQSPHDLELLRAFGCHAAQGFYFSEPLDAAALLSGLSRRGGRLPWPEAAGGEQLASGRVSAVKAAR
jgi:EAL domain-containing protein (putative c-di-GMP-specific phosphodiesterase class I)